MNKVLIGAGALLLSSSTLAGSVHANNMAAAGMTNAGVAATSAAWSMNPLLFPAVTDAGLLHAHAESDWMTSTTTDMSADMGATGKAVGAVYDSFEGPMSYQEAAAWTGDKPTETSAAHAAEKQSWLAQNQGSADMATADMSGSAETGKNTEIAAVHVAEKDSWLSQNGGGSADMSAAADTMATAEVAQAALPACRPGPGDDRCVQLYERGVRAAFAQWQAGRERLGMGGPEEPAVTGKDEMASAEPMTADMSAKTDNPAGPTTEPTGVRVDKSASAATLTGEGTADMSASAHSTMAHDGMTAEAMQTNSAWGAQANAG